MSDPLAPKKKKTKLTIESFGSEEEGYVQVFKGEKRLLAPTKIAVPPLKALLENLGFEVEAQKHE